MKAVIVAHGDVDPADAAQLRGADLIVAADGGSEHLRSWGVAPHVVVGDLDSAVPLEGATVERHPRDKDKTDTELAVERAIAAGADDVVILGALGGPRVDHALANALLLVRGWRASVRLVRGATTVRVVRGGATARLAGAVGSIVTLLALGSQARGVVTQGLRYPLTNEDLDPGSSRGVSNVIAAPGASVTTAGGALLVIEIALPPGAEQQTKP